MTAWRMLVVAARLVGPYWYAPWRSPLLRWRMETYGITDSTGRLLGAAEVTPRRFLGFCWQQQRTLYHFLRWAATLA